MRIFFTVILFLPFIAKTQLQLGKVFSDNMVLQRDMPVHIWGKGTPGKKVEVIVTKAKKGTVVRPDSSWSLYFTAQKANSNPQSIVVSSGNNVIELHNILFGDLWVCIGQSNMEWPMIKEMHFKEEILQISQPLLRFYNPTYAGKNVFGITFSDSIIADLTTDRFYKGQWQNCDSSTISTMSAVAYYFGKNIAKTKNIPIGLIHLAIGGAPLESFISKEAMKKDRHFAVKTKGNWLTNDALPVWIRERGRQNVGNSPEALTDETGPGHGYKPGFAFDAGIATILSLPVKGILCYQGESNAQEMERVNEYAALSSLMISDYRKKWKQAQLPFYFVQLSSIDTIKYKGHFWASFRNEQREMLKLIPNSGMAVCSDIGARDDVHPADKKTVGERLARWALNKTYKYNNIPSGPLPLNANYENGKIIINFQYTGKELQTSDRKPLRGFSLDGRNEVAASIHSTKVEIEIAENPGYIYYGWKSYNDANLVNFEQLPASTFKIKLR